MPARKPHEVDLLLHEALLERGDLDAAVALYEQDAVFVVSPNNVVSGHTAIREILEEMLAAGPTGQLDAVTSVTSVGGTIAVTRTKGNVTSVGPDGKLVSVPFRSVEVFRRQLDGTWLFVIDDPGGEGVKAIRAEPPVAEGQQPR